MKKQNIFLLASLSLVLAACGPSQSVILNPATQNKAEQAKQALKLSEIIANGGNATCQITNLTNPTESSSMVISGKKMKISGASIDQGKKGFFINDGTYTYIWSEDGKDGFKMKNPETTPSPENTGKNPSVDSTSLNNDQIINDYEDQNKFKVDCQTNTAKDADFIPPTTVKFTDPSELMKGLKGSPTVPAE